MGVEEGEEGQQQIDMKSLGTYNPHSHKNTQFFTTYEAHMTFDDIIKALCTEEGIQGKVHVDEHKYKMNFTINQKMPEMDLGSDEEEE